MSTLIQNGALYSPEFAEEIVVNRVVNAIAKTRSWTICTDITSGWIQHARRLDADFAGQLVEEAFLACWNTLLKDEDTLPEKVWSAPRCMIGPVHREIERRASALGSKSCS